MLPLRRSIYLSKEEELKRNADDGESHPGVTTRPLGHPPQRHSVLSEHQTRPRGSPRTRGPAWLRALDNRGRRPQQRPAHRRQFSRPRQQSTSLSRRQGNRRTTQSPCPGPCGPRASQPRRHPAPVNIQQGQGRAGMGPGSPPSVSGKCAPGPPAPTAELINR